MAEQSEDKFPISWHRGFGLVRSAVASVVRALAEGNTRKQVEASTTLGPDQFTAAINYAEKSGLIWKDKPTAFGGAVLEKDSTLSKLETQWVMHYFLAVPRRTPPSYWSQLVLHHLPISGRFGTSEAGEAILEMAKVATGAEPSERTIKAGANAFLSTYTKDEGLGTLSFFEESNTRGQYIVRQPRTLPLGAFAGILADYWEQEWPNRSDVMLEDVTQKELAHVLLLSENKVNDLLAELAAPDMALVKRQRKHIPYQVLRQDGLRSADLWPTVLYA